MKDIQSINVQVQKKSQIPVETYRKSTFQHKQLYRNSSPYTHLELLLKKFTLRVITRIRVWSGWRTRVLQLDLTTFLRPSKWGRKTPINTPKTGKYLRLTDFLKPFATKAVLGSQVTATATTGKVGECGTWWGYGRVLRSARYCLNRGFRRCVKTDTDIGGS